MQRVKKTSRPELAGLLHECAKGRDECFRHEQDMVGAVAEGLIEDAAELTGGIGGQARRSCVDMIAADMYPRNQER